MKLTYFGHACFSLAFDKGPTLVIDPFDESVNYPPCDIACDAALLSHDHFDHNHVASLKEPFAVIRQAGDYEVLGAKIHAMESFHDEQEGALRGKNLLFKIEKDGITIAHLGDLGHMPTKEQRAFLENVDVMLIPIGGFYTIDTAQAIEILRSIKPRCAVGMHFTTPAYPAAMSTEEEFEKETRAERMPRAIEITKDTLATLPENIIMSYK